MGGRGWAPETHLNHVQRRVKCSRTTRLRRRIYARYYVVTNDLLFIPFSHSLSLALSAKFRIRSSLASRFRLFIDLDIRNRVVVSRVPCSSQPSSPFFSRPLFSPLSLTFSPVLEQYRTEYQIPCFRNLLFTRSRFFSFFFCRSHLIPFPPYFVGCLAFEISLYSAVRS